MRVDHGDGGGTLVWGAVVAVLCLVLLASGECDDDPGDATGAPAVWVADE